jgi:aspartate/methionine/tyrosine aminotransferase
MRPAETLRRALRFLMESIMNKENLINTQQREQALTEIEVMGLASPNDMANGHASQNLALSQQRIIAKLPQIWEEASRLKSREAEIKFKDVFRLLAEAPSLSSYEHFKICPTASNSIDTVATWLAAKNMKTALLEPTFDNLYLILKRRGVQIRSLPDDLLYEKTLDQELKLIGLLSSVDAVFLVNPNNPTGRTMTEEQFASIANWCALNKKVLILDNTFRFFVPQVYDTYQILLDSGVRFLSIEDTGKVWPTQEIKASLLFTSADIFQEIDHIYDEIFLCHSNFALGLLAEFLKDAHERGLAEAVWKDVAARRKKFRRAIEETVLQIHPLSIESTISVEWVKIAEHFNNDIDLIEHFKTKELILLSGRQFYWSKDPATLKTDCARFALLKPEHAFQTSISILAKELRSLKS